MREINFITSNKGKVAALERALSEKGLDNVRVIGHNLNLIEPQFDTVAEVSAFKARQAFDILKKPVLVEDGGFCIEALNDFPGVYTKYILDTIGAAGLLMLMRDVNNRRARFVGHATFVDEKGQLHAFSRQGGYVLIADKMSATHSSFAWSDLWKIIYDEVSGKCLSDMTEEEVNQFYNREKSVGSVQQFATWYANTIK